MSKASNPIELVDRYLQAVRFWLPKTDRQDDLIAELGEDLRSQIEAREEELGHSAGLEDVSAILKRCGPPMVMASRLGPRRHLIGPGLYPIYIFVMKMVLLWIQVPVFVFIVGPVNFANANGSWGSAIASTIAGLWSAWFIAGGVITLVFAFLERSQSYAATACKWDPTTLPPLQRPDRKVPSRLQTVCQLGFGVFGLVWLLLIPEHPVMILGPAAAFLKAAPMWHAFYVPIVLLSVLSLLRSVGTLARPQWTWFPPLAELAQAVFSLLLLHFILQAGFPYVLLKDAAKESVQFIKVAAIVNVSILISLACAWLGLCLALLIQVWQLFRLARQRRKQARQAASLPVH